MNSRIPLDSSASCSSEEDDFINPNYFQKMNLPSCKSTGAIRRYPIHDDADDQPETLKPKMKVGNQKTLPNNSHLSNNSQMMSNSQGPSAVSRRPLTAAYTFKLKAPQKKKRNDPVSLFQQTSQAWKKDRFLTSRAHDKEGRKLDLEKRNKVSSKVVVSSQFK